MQLPKVHASRLYKFLIAWAVPNEQQQHQAAARAAALRAAAAGRHQDGPAGHAAALIAHRSYVQLLPTPPRPSRQPHSAHRQPSCRNSLISWPGSNPGPTTLPCRVSR